MENCIQLFAKYDVIDGIVNIIGGFYAAAEVTSGIHCNSRGEGPALADIVIFGHIAGQSVIED